MKNTKITKYDSPKIHSPLPLTHIFNAPSLVPPTRLFMLFSQNHCNTSHTGVIILGPHFLLRSVLWLRASLPSTYQLTARGHAASFPVTTACTHSNNEVLLGHIYTFVKGYVERRKRPRPGFFYQCTGSFFKKEHK